MIDKRERKNVTLYVRFILRVLAKPAGLSLYIEKILICHLSSSHLVYATFITVVGAFFSSLLAAWKAIQIDPAEALREE